VTTTHSHSSTPPPADPAPVNWHRELHAPEGAPLDARGRLPLNEVAADRCGAASPFGDDIEFPVNPATLNYYHPGKH
jgi:succinate dehydrogenase / fumarate reductase, iron-sulfur subunit